MRNSFRKTFCLVTCLTALPYVTACDLNEPTWVAPSRVEVHEEGFTDTFDTSALDAGTLRAIGVNYYRYGNGPMDVSVSYDQNSKTNSAARAGKEASRIEDALRRNGVNDLRIGTSPNASGDKSTTLVSFPALTAKAPEGCGVMPGYADKQTNAPDNANGETPGYQIGCTIEGLMAQQVARPGDLLGRPGFETNAEGRRQEAVVWKRGYYRDASNPPLVGQTASEE